MNDEIPETTEEAKTMWSMSLLDGLYTALRKNKSDSVVKAVITDLRDKNYSDQYIINKVKQTVSPEAGERIQELLTGRKPPTKAAKKSEPKVSSLSKADQARANAAKKRKENSFIRKTIRKIKKIKAKISSPISIRIPDDRTIMRAIKSFFKR